MDFNEWYEFRENLEQIAKDAGLDISKFDKKELRLGFDDEKEHDGGEGKDVHVVDNKADILKIVIAHLREDPHYYSKMSKVIK